MTKVSDDRAYWLARNVLPHEPALRAWLSRRRLSGLEIDDIIQETYARLITADSVLHIKSPKSYAFQTANSVIMSHLRGMKIVTIGSVAEVEQLNVASPDPSPEELAISRDELEFVARAIESLPDRVRQVFTLRRISGLSQREVAQRMGIAESTVEKHMNKGFLLMLGMFSHGGNGVELASKSPARTRTKKAYGKKDGARD